MNPTILQNPSLGKYPTPKSPLKHHLQNSSKKHTGILKHPIAISALNCHKLLSGDNFSLPKATTLPRCGPVKRIKVVQKFARPMSHPAITIRSDQSLMMPTPPQSQSSSSPTKNAFTKHISFADTSEVPSSISWPKLAKKVDSGLFEPADKSVHLARSFLKYLNELGITDSTLVSRDSKLESGVKKIKLEDSLQKPGKEYFCELAFTVSDASDEYSIKLELEYEVKPGSMPSLHPSLFISNEQLCNYLKDKLIFRQAQCCTPGDFVQMETKIKRLLNLVGLRCCINGLEVEL